MRKFKLFILTAALVGLASFMARPMQAQTRTAGADNFYQSQETSVQKVAFQNQYKMKVAGNLFLPKGLTAHSIEFSQSAYQLAAEPKELLIVPGAGHVDLYDRVNLIPWDKLEAFFKAGLK